MGDITNPMKIDKGIAAYALVPNTRRKRCPKIWSKGLNIASIQPTIRPEQRLVPLTNHNHNLCIEEGFSLVVVAEIESRPGPILVNSTQLQPSQVKRHTHDREVGDSQTTKLKRIGQEVLTRATAHLPPEATSMPHQRKPRISFSIILKAQGSMEISMEICIGIAPRVDLTKTNRPYRLRSMSF